jgi:hypothetical protein
MSLMTRVTALAQAIGADIKALTTSVAGKAAKGTNSDITSLQTLTAGLFMNAYTRIYPESNGMKIQLGSGTAATGYITIKSTGEMVLESAGLTSGGPVLPKTLTVPLGSNAFPWLQAYIKTLTMNGPVNEAPVVTLPSSASLDIGGALANTILISGTTTIGSFGTVASGVRRTLIFQGALTLTYNAASMILPGGANLVTAAGDTAEFVSLGSGNWRCVRYQRYSLLDGLLPLPTDASKRFAYRPGTGWVDAPTEFGTSVKTFGAVGDGVTDDTVAIQAAIDSGAAALYFPGQYLVTSLTAKSNQVWFGDGMLRSGLIWAVANKTADMNMVVSAGDLNDFTVRSMGFKGNRASQTTQSSTGQGFNAFYLRGGSCVDVSFERCMFQEFGDKDGIGGGGVIIGALSGSGKALENIRFADCVFKNISNVPGIYVNGASTYHTSVRNISITGCDLRVGVTGVRQNGFYVLGGTTTPAYNIRISDNTAQVDQSMDAVLELNYSQNFSISDNLVQATGSASCTPVLIRENCSFGVIANNAIHNLGTGNTATDAIALSRLTGAGVQSEIVIQGNEIIGWSPGAFGNCINIAAGSLRISAVGNLFRGKAAGAAVRTGVAIAVTGTLIKVSDNQVFNATYFMTVGAVSFLSVEDNQLTSCGDGTVGLLVEAASQQAITNATIKGNTVNSVAAGTPNFVSMSSTANTGNRVENNLLPTGVAPINPSFSSAWAAVVTPPRSGALISGTDYQFDQGALDGMANGSGFTIGGNLDATAPACVLGDKVLVSASVDLKGCVVTAYVQAAGVIRVRVQNNTGATVSLAAGTWYVTLLKRV